ncbi:MAG: cupin domain-containing protein [Kiritimatiellae bacterium]|jgi:glucose-6-phosphate isomerase|nr:cupin domain-containing protein [Kiritimatiellia bacterium]
MPPKFMLSDISLDDLCVSYGLDSARIGDRPFVQRRLSDLRGCFADTEAYEAARKSDDPVLYEVTAIEPATGDGQLHYGLGILYPGKIGNEYYLTKGHLHSHRPAAEIYVGLKGQGVMLLEDEASGESRMASLAANQVVYVPGHTAHRTLNTGTEPLMYLGIYPSNAGHDYGAIAELNFSHLVIERDGAPVMIPRKKERT